MTARTRSSFHAAACCTVGSIQKPRNQLRCGRPTGGNGRRRGLGCRLVLRRGVQRRQLGLFLGQQPQQRSPRGLVSLGLQLLTEVGDVELSDRSIHLIHVVLNARD